ncbi:MAG: ADP-ribosylglycohydrolase family protein [Thermodesulfobacteriota bacterium]|jgi:ADP-ribosylglycohydrolase
MEKDRYHGSLIGLAVRDALGTTLEFKSWGPSILSNEIRTEPP